MHGENFVEISRTTCANHPTKTSRLKLAPRVYHCLCPCPGSFLFPSRRIREKRNSRVAGLDSWGAGLEPAENKDGKPPRRETLKFFGLLFETAAKSLPCAANDSI